MRLWRGPMSRKSGGIPLPDIGPDGLDPVPRKLRDGVGICHLRYRRHKSPDDLAGADSTGVGAHDARGVPCSSMAHEFGRFFVLGAAIVTHDCAGNATTERVCYRCLCAPRNRTQGIARAALVA